MREKLISLRNQFLNLICTSSKSKQSALFYNILDFNSLCTLCDCQDLIITLPMVETTKIKLLSNEIFIHTSELYNFSKNVIDSFKGIDFYCYLRRANVKLSEKDQAEIINDFLKGFMPALKTIFDDLVKKDNIFTFREDESCMGSSFLMSEIKNYFLGIGRNAATDSIWYMETIIHELMHIYVAKFLENYSILQQGMIQNSFYLEAPSLFAELAFYEYCMKHHIHPEEVTFSRNLTDYFLLSNYKCVYYFCSKLQDPNSIIDIYDDIFYVIRQNKEFDCDLGVPFFQYHIQDYEMGKLNEFFYTVSAPYAFYMLKFLKDGYDLAYMINDFVLTADEIPLTNINTDYMMKEIKKHQDFLKKISPIPGYSVKK